MTWVRFCNVDNFKREAVPLGKRRSSLALVHESLSTSQIRTERQTPLHVTLKSAFCRCLLVNL